MTFKEIVEDIKKGAVTAGFFGLALVSLGGCAEEIAHATPTDTVPVATQRIEQPSTPNAVLTNTPSPTPKPTPTSMPELTLEQKTLLLGIGKESEPYKVEDIDVYHCKWRGHNYRFWTIALPNKEKTKNSNGFFVLDVIDVNTNVYLFSISLPNNGVDKDGQGFAPTQFYEFLFETNPALKGIKLELSFGLFTGSRTYNQLGIEYNNNSVLDEFRDGFSRNSTQAQRDKVSNTILSAEKRKEIFLDSTPQEEIMPYWVFTPGAKIPDELKGIYSEVDYPPALALPETTVQQSNRTHSGYEKGLTSVAAKVRYGYREPGYYNPIHTVTKVNHPNQYRKAI